MNIAGLVTINDEKYDIFLPRVAPAPKKRKTDLRVVRFPA